MSNIAWNAPATLAMIGFLMAVAPAHAAAPAQPVAPAPVKRPISGLKAVTTIRLGKTADWVAITADAVWVGSTSPNAVHRIDPNTNSETASVSVPGEPCAGLAPGFGSLWVPLCAAKPALARIDLRSNRLVTVLGFGTAAECGITASDDSIWLVLDGQGTLARIDPANGSIRQTVKLPPESCNPRYAEKGAGTVFRQFVGAGGDSLAIGHGAIWLTNFHEGTIARFRIAEATSR
jgi:virginiamycin B lyase